MVGEICLVGWLFFCFSVCLCVRSSVRPSVRLSVYLRRTMGGCRGEIKRNGHILLAWMDGRMDREMALGGCAVYTARSAVHALE